MEDLRAEQAPVDFKKEGLKYGLLNGILGLCLMYGTYYIGFDAFTKMQFIGRFIPYMMLILILAGLQIRKRNGGYLPFKDAIKFTFLSYVISSLLIAIGTYVLFAVIDKGLTERLFQAGIEKTRLMMETMNAPKEEMDKLAKQAASGPTDTSLKTIFLGLGQDLILNFVLSMLVSIIIRKEKPVLN
ncbi:MAG: hypothetical protein JWP88_1787 [Flaviaesturariibacter sp.]|nr:hypothetical protein [Flaviaesturariibacter sp.]